MLTGILISVIVVQILYILSLRKNISEIAERFSEKLSVDTNTCMQLFGSLINFDTFASVPTFFRLPSFSSFNTATNMPPFFSMA